MDIYHVRCDLRPANRDQHFHENAARCMDHLRAEGLIESWRLTRRQLAHEPDDWHLLIELRELRRIEDTFQRMSTRGDDEEEGLHQAMNAQVTKARFSLTRGLPEPC
jgi:hypothetical protein